MKTPLSARAWARASGWVTVGNSDFFDTSISTTIPSTTPPSSICTTPGGHRQPEHGAADRRGRGQHRQRQRQAQAAQAAAQEHRPGRQARWPAPPAGRHPARSRDGKERSCRRWGRTRCPRRCRPVPRRCPIRKQATKQPQRPDPPCGHGRGRIAAVAAVVNAGAAMAAVWGHLLCRVGRRTRQQQCSAEPDRAPDGWHQEITW